MQANWIIDFFCTFSVTRPMELNLPKSSKLEVKVESDFGAKAQSEMNLPIAIRKVFYLSDQ